MAVEHRSYVFDTPLVPAGDVGDGNLDSWASAELIHAPDYDPAFPERYTITGGSHTVDGPGAASVTIVEERVLTEADDAISDPGWGVHYQREPLSGSSTFHITLNYDVTVP